MVLLVNADVQAALSDSHVRSHTYGVARYQSESRVLELTAEGNITWQASGDVQASGSIRAFGYGDSLVTRSRTGLLAPFGQEVQLFREVQLRGDRRVTIPLGVYRVTGNDGGRESMRWPHAQGSPPVVTDWEMGVNLADRLRTVERAKLVNPKGPLPGGTVYSELQRLLAFPLVRTLPDMLAPPALAYENRSSAVTDLCSVLGGVPRLTRQGALTVRPKDRWLTEEVPEFDISGTISWNDEQSDDFYNLVWAHSDDGEFSAIVAFDDITHPLSVQRAGESSYEHSSPQYTSNDSAYKGASTSLRRLLYRRSRVVRVEVGAIGLLLETSDFGWFRDELTGRAVLGEISGLSIPNDSTNTIAVDVIVAEEM